MKEMQLDYDLLEGLPEEDTGIDIFNKWCEGDIQG